MKSGFLKSARPVTTFTKDGIYCKIFHCFSRKMYAMSKRRGNEREILDDLYRKGMVGTGLKEKTFFKEMVLKSPQTLDWRRPKLPFHVPLASVKLHYYSFKIFSRFWLAKSTRSIHHNQLLMTKFGRILCLTRKWRQKCSVRAGNKARTARRQLEGRLLLFGEYLRSWTNLNVHYRRWT